MDYKLGLSNNLYEENNKLYTSGLQLTTEYSSKKYFGLKKSIDTSLNPFHTIAAFTAAFSWTTL